MEQQHRKILPANQPQKQIGKCKKKQQKLYKIHLIKYKHMLVLELKQKYNVNDIDDDNNCVLFDWY